VTGGLLSAERFADVFPREGIRLVQRAHDKWDALHQAAALLIELGAVSPEYEGAMRSREEQISTYMGEGVAIPHGTNEGRAFIKRTTIGLLQYPEGVDWDGEVVRLVIPIAAAGEEQIELLSSIALLLLEADEVKALQDATHVEQVMEIISRPR